MSLQLFHRLRRCLPVSTNKKLRIFVKIRNSPWDIKGPDSWKKTWRQKSRVSRLPLKREVQYCKKLTCVVYSETLCSQQNNTQPFRNLSLLAYWNSVNNDSSLTLWSVSLEIQIIFNSCEKLLLRKCNVFQKTFSSFAKLTTVVNSKSIPYWCRLLFWTVNKQDMLFLFCEFI
jgi:hypothetical protein